MEARRSNNAFIVGIFVVIAIAIFVLLVFTLGGEKKTFSKKFSVKVLFTDINGLKEGNNVWFSGVKIGTVKKIELTSKSTVEVTLNIEEKAGRYIRKDANAKIGSEGFLGNKVVIIYGGNPTTPPVSSNDYLSVQKDTRNEDIMATLQSSNKNLLEITGDVRDIIKKIKEGEGPVGKLINDPALARSLQATISNFNTVSVNSKKIIATMQDFASRINSENSSINKLFTDTDLYDSIKNAIVQIQTIVTTANEFANNMNTFSNNLKTASDNLSDTTRPAGLALSDKGTASDIQTTINNLKSASKKLDEDMEAMQHNFLLKGYFKKQKNTADTTTTQ